MDETKRLKIKDSILRTREKRKSQKCRVFELKVINSRLNKVQKETLKMFFIEAKWLYNNILRETENGTDIFKYDYKNKKVVVLDKYRNPVEKELFFLPAQVRQGIVSELQQNIVNLSKSKKKNLKVGKLKFKRSVNSIDFGQYKVTHELKENGFKIAGIKKPLKVRGLNQLKDTFEYTNAKLVKKASGYFIKLTTYEFVKFEINKPKLKSEVGLDFGIKNHITTSEGEIFNCSVVEPDSLKKLQKQMFKKQKGSNNRYKIRLKIQKQYEKIDNKKDDFSNKLVSQLTKTYEQVYIQDEQLQNWHKGWFGKQIQHSCLGRIKSKLRSKPNVTMLSKFAPTTKLCYNCGKKNDLTLDERIYTCSCGLSEDRDIKAAKTILYLGKCNTTYGS